MTPTPREDTMTEQEPIDPWQDVMRQVRAQFAEYGVALQGHNGRSGRVKSLAMSIIQRAVDAARAADAAQVRERDAQIARLSAEVGRFKELYRSADIDADTLRAERDAAQQQIATLTAAREALAPYAQHILRCHYHFKRPDGTCHCGLEATLRSTRPQEQP